MSVGEGATWAHLQRLTHTNLTAIPELYLDHIRALMTPFYVKI
jgi:hypothetical protein